ncbi:MAG: glycosyltransferase [Candidatus Eremiobacteraeota bacterium]|nr:glycosyltransferase [Candidatus Eremiobacteraeota bacterium]
MNIGIFTNAYKPIISGVVNSIDLIKSGLEARGHRVFIFAPRYKGYHDKEKDVHRFFSVNLTNRVDFPVAIPYSFRLFKLIPNLKLDIIHTHHPFILGEVGVNFAKKLKIPLVYTFHTQFEQYSHYIPFNQDIVRKVTRFSVIKYAQKCNLIICPSTTILSLLDNYGITSPIEMIPNAIDISAFDHPDAEPVRKKYGLTQKDKLLIYVGRIGLEKNLGFMLKAFKKARERVPNVKLMIVGEGAELDSLKDLAVNLKIDDDVIFPGRVEYSDIPSYYGAGYAFIMTSTTEVKPLALLEAMASGLPVVAISAAGSSDTITPDFDGLLTDHDMDNYVNALLKLLEDKDYRDKLSSGAKTTSKKYSMLQTSERLEKLFMRVIEENRQVAV